MSLVLGLDIGTSGGRALIADAEGRRIGSASRPWRYRSEAPGYAELDTATVWASLASAVREAVRTSLARPDAIQAVAVTSQRAGVVLRDAKGDVLHAASNVDARGVSEGIALERAHRDLVYSTAGRLPVLMHLPARLAWFRANRPEFAARITHAQSFADWCASRLTGGEANVTDPSLAAEMMLYDIAHGWWSDALCDALGVSRRMLPQVSRHATTAGRLPEDVAREFGLHPGTPVVIAGADTQCAALGAGIYDPGAAAVVAGTVLPVQQVTGAVVLDEDRRLWTSPHVVPNRWVIEAGCGDAGAAVDYLLALMGRGGDYGWLELAVSRCEPGAGGVTFFDPGPIHSGNYPLVRRGGLLFPTPVLAVGRGQEDIVRAAYESIAYASRAGLEWLEEAGGAQSEVAVCGGLARSSTFARIVASVLGRTVRRTREPNISALGACVVGAAAAGLHSTIAAAAAAMHDRGEIVHPLADWGVLYDGLYGTWRERRTRFEETLMRVNEVPE
ncbi:MAG: FGGY family carbohydrate kinase [Actinomycetota bacterium]|nr:FGGY-family carbohydrate kinase [Actinomycetota bacterium]